MDSTENNSNSQNKTVGQYIKNAREAMGVDLDSLANETKLKRQILEALEADRTNELPPLPYIKAFLVTLCRRLELDSEELFKRLNSQMGIHPDEDLNPEHRENLNVKSSPKGFMPLILISVLVVVFLVIMVKMQGSSNEDSLPEPIAQSTLDSLPGLSEMESMVIDSLDSAKLVGTPDADSNSPAADDAVSGQEPEKKSKEPAKVEEEIKESAAPPAINGILVFSCVTDSVWINIKRNGRKEINKKLKLGGQWRIAMTDSIYVSVGVHSAVEFDLNGVKVSPEERKFKIINGVYSPN